MVLDIEICLPEGENVEVDAVRLSGGYTLYTDEFDISDGMCVMKNVVCDSKYFSNAQLTDDFFLELLPEQTIVGLDGYDLKADKDISVNKWGYVRFKAYDTKAFGQMTFCPDKACQIQLENEEAANRIDRGRFHKWYD